MLPLATFPTLIIPLAHFGTHMVRCASSNLENARSTMALNVTAVDVSSLPTVPKPGKRRSFVLFEADLDAEVQVRRSRCMGAYERWSAQSAATSLI